MAMVCNQSLETETDNDANVQLLVDEQKEQMRDLLFSSSNMVAMTSLENQLLRAWHASI